MTILSIAPAAGFGQLRFGASYEDVRAHLGEASQIIEPAGEPGRQIHVFNDLQLAAGFDASGQLDTFEVWNPQATLYGCPIIGLGLEEAALLLREKFSFPIEAQIHDDDDVEQLCIRDLGFGVWFEDQIVTSVSWSDATSAEDQSIAGAAPS